MSPQMGWRAGFPPRRYTLKRWPASTRSPQKPPASASIRDGRNARFQVEDVWVGHLRETVTVYGLSSEQVSEDDRAWQVGARYLVLPIVDGDVLRDSICSATTEWSPELVALRPVGAPSSDTGVAVPLLPILAVAAFVVVLLAAFVGYDRYIRRPGP
jgi:hypothetical protein